MNFHGEQPFRGADPKHRLRHRRFSEAIGFGEWKRAALLVFVGCVSLSAGVLVYLSDRVASHAALIPTIDALGSLHLFGALGQWLPSFVHPLAFSLFSAAVLKPGVAACGAACTFWAVVDVAFEVGQHPALAATWAAALHGGLGEWAIARATLRYFLQGTFDPYDGCAAMLGALIAGALLLFFDHSPGRTPCVELTSPPCRPRFAQRPRSRSWHSDSSASWAAAAAASPSCRATALPAWTATVSRSRCPSCSLPA